MKKLTFTIFLVSLFIFANAQSDSDLQKNILGTWKLKQAEATDTEEFLTTYRETRKERYTADIENLKTKLAETDSIKEPTEYQGIKSVINMTEDKLAETDNMSDDEILKKVNNAGKFLVMMRLEFTFAKDGKFEEGPKTHKADYRIENGTILISDNKKDRQYKIVELTNSKLVLSTILNYSGYADYTQLLTFEK